VVVVHIYRAAANVKRSEFNILYTESECDICSMLGRIDGKAVADKKGLSVVVDKNQVVYGGQDITQEVAKNFK
jgi:Skp family chaperone for outer membrane proteins